MKRYPDMGKKTENKNMGSGFFEWLGGNDQQFYFYVA